VHQVGHWLRSFYWGLNSMAVIFFNIALDSGLRIVKKHYNRSYKSCMKMLFRAKVKITNMATLELLKLYQTNVTYIPYQSSHVSGIAACAETA
jgi:hypothetical protein